MNTVEPVPPIQMSRWVWIALGVVGVFGASLFEFLAQIVDGSTWRAALSGWGLGIALGLLGCFSAQRALRAGKNAFMGLLLGGMALRLLVVGVALVVVALSEVCDIAGFTLGLLTAVVVANVVEIRGLVQSVRRHPGAQSAEAPPAGVMSHAS